MRKKLIFILGLMFLLAGLMSFMKYLTVPQAETPAELGTPPLNRSQSSEQAAENAASDTSPVDFEQWYQQNPDMIAWIEISDTEISYPIAFRDGDNSFYLNHNINGDSAVEGALFLEDYNDVDFSDPVTIIYGHNMKSGTMFGSLRKLYADPKWFEEHPEIQIYLPDRTITYETFAALPYSSMHILYYYDFSESSQFHDFIESIYGTRNLEANFRNMDFMDQDERILILSTCIGGDENKRYLVLAREKKGGSIF